MSPRSTGRETGEEVVRSLADKGVDYLFANFGTDHPPLIKALAEGADTESPSVIVSPHEMVAASAAHGYAQVTGDPQAVLVHVDVGTANLGASVHNASRCRVPMFLLAGRSPLTTEGELPGTRNLYVHYYQDVYDQHSIVREYTKWEYELETGETADKVVARGVNVATAHPQGPVYMTMPREILRSKTENYADERARIQRPQSRTVLDEETLSKLCTELENASHPLLITTYLGRDEEAVSALLDFVEATGVPVTEAYPVFDMNYPRTNDLHVGFEPWTHLDDADLIFVVNCDVPWIPSEKTPRPDATVVQIDVDTTKSHIPFWDFETDLSIQAEPRPILEQLAAAFDTEKNASLVEERNGRFAQTRAEWREALASEVSPLDEAKTITPALLSRTIGQVIEPDDIVVDETVTNTVGVLRYLERSEPGTYYSSCSSGLGWSTGAAIGVKLARPDARVINLVGDGAFVFGNPFASIQMAQAYDLPHVNVVYNNSGWEAVNLSTKGQYGDADFDYERLAAFDPPIEFADCLGALGCHAERVTDPASLVPALERALEATDDGTHAVVDVALDQDGGY